jgi:DNA polymerase I
MKLVFWLLDVNHETRAQKPEIWLWGVDDKGQRILIIDSNFHAYFYLGLKETADPQAVIKSIETRRASDFSSIIKLEAVERRYFGKPVKTVRVTCQNPDLVPKYAKAMSKIEGVKESLEDDTRYSMRYLIDNQMAPCSWHEIEAEQIDNTMKAQVDKVYKAKSLPKSIEKTEIPKLRVLGFSTLAYSSKGAPKPEKDPVVLISTATNQGKESKQFVAKDSDDDKTVLEAFVKHVRDFDPDVIVGCGTNRQDWSYLTARSKKLGIKLFVGRANTEPHMSVYGHVSVTGRANVDLFDFADELPPS